MNELNNTNSKDCVLIVDDQESNLMILKDVLEDIYTVVTRESGEEALSYLENQQNSVDIVLLDVRMPGIDGFEVCRRIKEHDRLQEIPVLFLTGLTDKSDEAYGLKLGAADFISKPFSVSVVRERVKTHLKLSHALRALRGKNEQLESLVEDRTKHIEEQACQLKMQYKKLVQAQDSTLAGFCSLAETRDNETGSHIKRTQNYVKALAAEMSSWDKYKDIFDDTTIDLIYKSAPLHDVGKVGIPDAILLKPGKLTVEEFEVMKKHCEYGRNVIAKAADEHGSMEESFLRFAREIAYSHHERWDGTGYPQGLRGENIPLSARLMSVADVYDALISERVYKKAYSHEVAKAIIMDGKGSQFDPDVVDAFVRLEDEFQEIAMRYRDHIEFKKTGSED